jgi:hypothetical protein
MSLTRALTAVLAAALFLTTPAAEQKAPSGETETSAKERAILEIERRALDEEIRKFEAERTLWEQQKKARQMVRGREDLGVTDLSGEWAIRNTVNRIISESFAEFLEERGREGSGAMILLVSISLDDGGKVTDAAITQGTPDEGTRKDILKICRRMDFSPLKGRLGNGYSRTFPLLLKGGQ